MLETLIIAYPEAPKTALEYSNPLEILVATILSAQCTDARVNTVTKELFKKYKKAKDYANCKTKELEKDVKSTGFYRNKAKNIQNAARMILADYDGKVPDSMEELVKLPGVARKTANIVLFIAFDKIEGIAVDTHVRRLSKRMNLSKNNDPVKIEEDLMKTYDKSKWGVINKVFIEHGRNTCTARHAKCSECPIDNLCPKIDLKH